MTFEDLSEYDLNLIRSLSIGLLTNTKMVCRYEAMTETVLGCIYSKGFKIQPYPDDLFVSISNTLKSRSHGRQWPSQDVIKEIFIIITELKLEILKDETREATWVGPRASWYTPYVTYKKPWMI